MSYEFIVITKVPTPPEDGNLATALGDLFYASGEPVPPMTQLGLSIPVFTLGEIIVADTNGREIGGRGRKPAKWFVEHETFDFPLEAIKRSREVTA